MKKVLAGADCLLPSLDVFLLTFLTQSEKSFYTFQGHKSLSSGISMRQCYYSVDNLLLMAFLRELAGINCKSALINQTDEEQYTTFSASIYGDILQKASERDGRMYLLPHAHIGRNRRALLTDVETCRQRDYSYYSAGDRCGEYMLPALPVNDPLFDIDKDNRRSHLYLHADTHFRHWCANIRGRYLVTHLDKSSPNYVSLLPNPGV